MIRSPGGRFFGLWGFWGGLLLIVDGGGGRKAGGGLIHISSVASSAFPGLYPTA